MAKGDQRSNNMVKKPKQDHSPPKEGCGTSDRPMPPTTTVMPKGKLKNKQQRGDAQFAASKLSGGTEPGSCGPGRRVRLSQLLQFRRPEGSFWPQAAAMVGTPVRGRGRARVFERFSQPFAGHAGLRLTQTELRPGSPIKTT